MQLYWQAQEELSLDYTAFVHLIDESGQLVAQRDRPPAGYPTSDWRTGEIIIDRYTIDLPIDLPPGTYRL